MSEMQNLGDYIAEIESWIEQVRDDEIGVENYDFLDNVVHKGRDGNNGLGQIGAYLSIYENEEGDIEIDQELVDALEERQSELPQGGRDRFSNIIYEGKTKKREGKTLLERAEDESSSFRGGHQRLYNMLEAAKEEFRNLSEKPVPEQEMPDGRNRVSPRDNESDKKLGGQNSITQNQKTGQANPDGGAPASNNTQGGDNEMGDLDDLVEDAVGYIQDGASIHDAAERAVDDRDDYLNEVEAKYSEVVSIVEDGLVEIHDEGADLQYVVGRLEATLDNSKADDTMDSIRSMHDDLTN